MIFDTSAPLVNIRAIFNTYYSRVETIQSNLLLRFNLGRREGSLGYLDLWGILTNSNKLTQQTYVSEFANIIAVSQECNNTIDDKYMNLVGMVMSLDNYICYISDAFSRITDTSWSVGDGSIYQTIYGKQLSDGSFEVVRKGLQRYVTEIDKLCKEMEDKVRELGLIPGSILTEAYYEDLRDNFFLVKIREITKIIDEDVKKEIDLIVGIVEETKLALNTWLPETFKLVSYISLAFNLNKKLTSLTDKVLNPMAGADTEPANAITLLAISTTNYWKKEVLPDNTNRGHCLTQAILNGCRALMHPARLQSYIEKTWVLGIQKY